VERVGAKHCHLLIREHRSSRFYKLGEAKHGENRLEMSKHVMCWQDRISINGIKGFRRARSRLPANSFCIDLSFAGRWNTVQHDPLCRWNRLGCCLHDAFVQN